MKDLIEDLLKKQDRIIPIIGDNCFVGIIKENETEKIISFQEYITEKLIENKLKLTSRQKKEIAVSGYYGMTILCNKYVHQYDTRRAQFRKVVRSIIERGIRDNKIRLKNEIKEFLEAGRFDVIITTNAFHILEHELSEFYKKYNFKTFVPVAYKAESRAEEKLIIPSVYQIFGTCEGEYVLTEDDLLKFLHYLNIPNYENGHGASSLIKYLIEKSISDDGKGNCILMPIGCDNLPNWLFRFLWYPLSPELLLAGERDNYEGGIWYKYSLEKDFYNFLKEYNFHRLSEPIKNENDSSDPVLRVLTDKLKEKTIHFKSTLKKQLGVNWSENAEWDFFISYAKEDEEIAKKTYDILTEQCEKKVWMDKRGRIKVGEEYWNAIQYGIEHSQKFIFIITETYLNKAIDKNHQYETGEIGPTGVYEEIDRIRQHHLLKRRKDGQKGYLIPLIIDGTRVTYTDNNKNLHKDEILRNGTLEKLPKYKEYEMLQTEKLFNNIQDIICSEESLEEDLIQIFKN